MRAQKGAGSKYFDKTRQRFIFEKYYYTVAGVKSLRPKRERIWNGKSRNGRKLWLTEENPLRLH